MANVIDVVLFRSNVNTPWGFALQGGRDHHAALTVSKVIPRTPAEGKLELGEAVLAINGVDVLNATHMQIVNLVKNATGQLRITLNRKGIGRQVFITSTDRNMNHETSPDFKPASYREAHAAYTASPHAIRPQTYREAHDIPSAQHHQRALPHQARGHPAHFQPPVSPQLPPGGRFITSPRPPRQPLVYQVSNNRFGAGQTNRPAPVPKIVIPRPNTSAVFHVADNRARLASPSPKLQVRNRANKPIVFSVSDNRGFSRSEPSLPVNRPASRSQTPDRTPAPPLPPPGGAPPFQRRRAASLGRFKGAHPLHYYEGAYIVDNHIHQGQPTELFPHQKPIFRVVDNRFR